MIRFRTAVVAVLVSAGLVLLGPAAGAHVFIDSAEPNEDGSVRLTLVIDHSCDNAGTTSLEMQAPEDSTIVNASGPEDWEFEIDDGRITWDGSEFEEAVYGEFAIDALLTGEAGSEFVFPVEQNCSDGDGYAWDDSHEETPAPRVVGTPDIVQPPSVTQPATGGAQTWQIFALVGGVALVGGLAAHLWLPASPR